MTDETISLDDPYLHLHAEFFGGWAPVQAWGDVAGWPFYFRSRGQRWTFAVATQDGIDATDVYSNDRGFFREESYGEGEFDASYMPPVEARKIIRRCCKEFLAELGGV